MMKPAASLWIRLAKCYGLVLREVRRAESPAGLTLPQFDCLAQLLRHPEGITSRRLSEALLVTAGNVTGIVARLRARGLVTRRAHPRDGRAVLLTLTPAGRRLARAEVARHERRLAGVLAGLGSAEQARLSEGLDRLRHALEIPPRLALRRSA